MIAAAVTMAACGGSVSQADFLERADARCQDFRQRSTPLLRADPATGLPRVRNLRRLEKLMTRTAAELRELTAPKGDAEQVGRYIAGVQINANNVRRLAIALQGQRRKRIRQLRRRLNAGTAATRALAAEYGFKVCGST